MEINTRNFYRILVQLLYIWSCDAVQIQFNVKQIILEPGQTAVLDINIGKSLEKNLTLSFLYEEDDQIRPYQLREIISDLPTITIVPGQIKYSVLIVAKRVGEMLLHVNSSSPEIVQLHSVGISVRILNSFEELVLGSLLGWIYLIAWTTKQIPQVYLSWKTKSVEGVSMDFVVFNIVGNVGYMLYNVLLYTIEDIRTVYKSLHPMGIYPVELNDAICICIMTFFSLFQSGQCFIYDTGKQKVSNVYNIMLAIIVIFFTILLILTLRNYLYWLTFLTALSYLKVISAPLKNVPQVLHNYTRKSTEGWSVSYSWLDLTGALASVVQMLINAHNEDDWSSLWGNFPKLLLGSVHLCFDSVLLLQHYILYRNNTMYSAPSDDNEPSTKETSETKPDFPSTKGNSESAVPSQTEKPNEKTKILQ